MHKICSRHAHRSVPVFTEAEPSVLKPDNFDADAHDISIISVPVLTEAEPSVLNPIISTPTRTRHLIILGAGVDGG